MKIFYHSFLILLVIFVSGCATSRDNSETLVLSSVLDEKALKEQRQMMSPEQQSTYMAIQSLRDLPADETPFGESMGGQIQPFSGIIPPQFSMIDSSDEYYVLIMKNMKAIMPGVEYVFMDRENFITVAIGQVPLKKSYMERLEEPQLKNEIENLAKQHQAFYRRYYNTDMVWKISQIPFFKLDMRADYMHQATLQTDIRTTYFSNFSRRDIMLVTGPKENINANREMIDKMIHDYEGSLTDVPEGAPDDTIAEDIIANLTTSIEN